MTILISVASRNTATARAKPKNCTTRTRENANVPNTTTMIAAALVISDPVD